MTHFNRTMGCINGRPVLSQEDLDFIANHTAITRDEVEQQYDNFLTRHPDGKITKRDFRNLMQVTLFRNKRFALNEMFQQNASKFAIFYV